MITLPAGARILLATRPVDFRKGAHSLAALAAEVLGADPFSGAVLVFRSRRADRVKVLVWDGSGLVLVWKQLEGGAFRWPPVVDGALRLIRNPCDCLGSWRVPAQGRVCQGGRPWFGSTAMAHIVEHLSLRQLEARYRASQDATEARHLQAIWLLAQGRTFLEVARSEEHTSELQS